MDDKHDKPKRHFQIIFVVCLLLIIRLADFALDSLQRINDLH